MIQARAAASDGYAIEGYDVGFTHQIADSDSDGEGDDGEAGGAKKRLRGDGGAGGGKGGKGFTRNQARAFEDKELEKITDVIKKKHGVDVNTGEKVSEGGGGDGGGGGGGNRRERREAERKGGKK